MLPTLKVLGWALLSASNSFMTPFACLLIALGAWMAYGQKSREHRRLNQPGLEVLSACGSKLQAKSEDVARWLIVAAAVTTSLVLLAAKYQSPCGWLLLLSLYGLLLYGMWM